MSIRIHTVLADGLQETDGKVNAIASRLNNEIEKYRAEYEENTERLNELAVDSGAIERIAREKYLMKKPNEDIYVFEEDIEK